MTVIISLFALLLTQQSLTPTQAAAAAAIAKAATPADCVKAVEAFHAARLRELQQTTEKGQQRATALQEKAAAAKQCASRFDVKSVPVSSLVSLAELHTLAEQPDLAIAAVNRGLTVATLAPVDRATLLRRAIDAGLKEPKSAERNARLEKLVDQIDALAPVALEQVIAAHLAMRAYYWANDLNAGLVKHAKWIMDAATRFTADQRRQFGPNVMAAHVDMAWAWASEGKTAQAIDLLKRAKSSWADLPDTSGDIDPEIARLGLVGTMAAPLTAPRWLNMPAGTTTLDMKGSVTLLEFGAWWCKPCVASYPALNRLRQRFGAQGFRVVIETRLFGHFEGEGKPGNTLPEATEVERNRAYFARHGLDVPVGIGGHTTMVNGAPRFGRDENYEHYLVGAIPQIQLIDRNGRIRHIMVGFDEANEAGLAKLIEALLKEK